MAKSTSSFELALAPREPGTSAIRWLYESLRGAILDGRLPPGTRLPATRDLARHYRLSRGTIVAAYEHLKSEGYVEGTVGAGTFVSRVLPDDLLQVSRSPRRARRAPEPPAYRLSSFAARVRPYPSCGVSPTTAFRADQPALDLFPADLWGRLAARRSRRAVAGHLLGCNAAGYPPLQEAVAEYLTTSRGVRCAPEQVLIVSGVQEALDLAARVLLDPGDRVCMEDPGYLGAGLVFESFGADVLPVTLDAEGMRVPDPALGPVRLAYVTPAHQFPVGIGMSLPRRLALIEWARETGALIFEDDYDSEYRYCGRPIPALQGLDPHGVVLFSGTFNKVLFPALRLGYLVVPPGLVEPIAAAKSLASRHAPVLEQAVLCDFISEGHFARHIRRMREVYAERLDVLLERTRAELDGLLEIACVEAGLQTAAWLCDGIDGASAERAAAARGVQVTSLARYSRGGLEREGLQLGFAAVDADEIRRGVRELAAALEGLRRTGGYLGQSSGAAGRISLISRT